MIDIYKQADTIIEHLNGIFSSFDLGDAIQVNDSYIYIEFWLLDRDYKVRFHYLDKVFYSLEQLESDIFFHILCMVRDGRQSDPREVA